MTLPDSQLFELAREYDAAALAEIYDRYAEPIYRYLYRILGNAAESEDLTSEVFLKLLQTLGTRRAPRKQLAGWLYRVAHNAAMDFLRKQGKRGTMPLEEAVASDSEPPSSKVEEQEASEKLRSSLQHLTVEQQQVILLRFGEELKLAEIAQLMGKSLGAVKIQQHRAIRRLRQLLD